MGSAVETPRGVEMAMTFPVARALGAWLIQVILLCAPDSPEKGVLSSPPPHKGGANTCRI